MDVSKSSESTVTITVSIQVELRTLLEEGTQEFAKRCREALEEELAPILGIGRAPEPAPPVDRAVQEAAAPDRAQELPGRPLEGGMDENSQNESSSMSAQLPPSAQRHRDR